MLISLMDGSPCLVESTSPVWHIDAVGGRPPHHCEERQRRPFFACCASFAGPKSAEAPEREGGSNPPFLVGADMDCFASLAMTAGARRATPYGATSSTRRFSAR